MTSLVGAGTVEAVLETSFVYLLIAAFCSTASEWIAALSKARARLLAETLGELLNHQTTPQGAAFAVAFYAHPVITAMMAHGRCPSYLPARSFVIAVLDLATPDIRGPLSYSDLCDSLTAFPQGDVRTSLLALIQDARGDLARAEVSIENWFNHAMARASRSYRQRTAFRLALIAITLTIAVNADTIGLMRGTASLGWDRAAQGLTLSAWLTRIAGWGVTVGAVSLGAPFWFAVLKRFVETRES